MKDFRGTPFKHGGEEQFLLGNYEGGEGHDRRQIDLLLRAHTRTLIKRHRIVIERVAKLLVEHKTLPSRQLDRVVAGSRLQ